MIFLFAWKNKEHAFLFLGYDSDDDYGDEHDRHLNSGSRRIKGKTYAALPIGSTEEVLDAKIEASMSSRSAPRHTGNMYNRYPARNETSINNNKDENEHNRMVESHSPYLDHKPTMAPPSHSSRYRTGQVHYETPEMSQSYTNSGSSHEVEKPSNSVTQTQKSDILSQEYHDEVVSEPEDPPPKPNAYVKHGPAGTGSDFLLLWWRESLWWWCHGNTRVQPIRAHLEMSANFSLVDWCHLFFLLRNTFPS